ncbi:MAG TPA: ferrochelatase, partial [Vicinamibacteria bacterium]|nr:ferrochelatase [Vicinamibacteria bacterium]
SAFSSYSGCRQYLENVEAARAVVGERAPQVDKLRVFYNHPGFIGPMARNVTEALSRVPSARRDRAALAFTAHSIPTSMASGSDYEAQLREAARLVAEQLGRAEWKLVFQSRSGPPSQPWLEPDILDHLASLKAEGATDVVVAPIGFISDHMEVVYDLDTEAAARARELGLDLVRASTVGTAPEFVAMIRELIVERTDGGERRALGEQGARHDVCAEDCCPAPAPRPPGPRP